MYTRSHSYTSIAAQGRDPICQRMCTPVNDVKFDFEDKFNLSYKSIATLTTAERRREAALHGVGNIDTRHGSQVCLHWLKLLCLKGEKCEFLHRLDLDRLPECQMGMNCTIDGCELPHNDPDEKNLCSFYEEGFCPYGPACDFKHTRRVKSRLPEEVDFKAKQANAVSAASSEYDQPDNPNFRTQLCINFEKDGRCKYGDRCSYAHGRAQLRNSKNAFGGMQTGMAARPAPMMIPAVDTARALRVSLNTRGFIIAVPNGKILEEFLREGVFGLANEHFQVARFINSSTPLFVVDIDGGSVHGMFEATTPVQPRMLHTLCAARGESTTPFPIQFRFRVLLRGDPISTDDMKRALVTVDTKGSTVGTRPLSVIALNALVSQFIQSFDKGRKLATDGTPLKIGIPIGTSLETPMIMQQLEMRRAFDGIRRRVGPNVSLSNADFTDAEGRPGAPSHEVRIESTDTSAFVLTQRIVQEEIAKIRIGLGMSPPLLLWPPIATTGSGPPSGGRAQPQRHGGMSMFPRGPPRRQRY